MNIYNNRLFNYLHDKEKFSAQKQLDIEGATVSDNDKYQTYITSNAKTTFWTILVVLALIIYAIIKRIW